MTPLPSTRTYEIQEVAELTGLATPRLRVWERRYEVVRPTRLANRYRTYTSEQVALLRAFARLCAAGERIGDLVREPVEAVILRAESLATPDGSPLSLLVDAVKRLDRDRLADLLDAHRKDRPLARLGEEIILPLAEVIGDLWALGKLTVAAEHLASQVVVPLLKQELRSSTGSGPVILAACLPGERHEWGVLVTMTGLQAEGWRVQYVGADLPFRDLVDAAWTLVPHAVALSAADPANVAARLTELRRLPRLLPPGTLLVLGGQGAEQNAARLRRIGLQVGVEAFPAVRPGSATPARP